MSADAVGPAMRRRRYLASVGAAVGLAGCSGSGDGGSNDDGSADDGGSGDGGQDDDGPGTATTSTTPTPEPAPTLRRVSVAATDDLDREFGTSLTAETVEPTVTTDHTAVLRVTLTNDADIQRSYVTTGRAVFFGPTSGGGIPLTVLLESPDGTDPGDRRVREDCWRLEDGIAFETVERNVVLEGGESASVDLAVWGHHKNTSEECLPTGTYRFETEYDALPVDGDGKAPNFPWGFEIEITDPE